MVMSLRVPRSLLDSERVVGNLRVASRL